MNRVFIFIVRLYQKFISPFKRPCCRFYPTCSQYSIQAFKKHGLIKGAFLTIRRLLRCNPYNAGGIDYVPDELKFFKRRKKDSLNYKAK